MQQYLTLLEKVLKEGNLRSDRTNTGTLSLFGYQMRFDLKKGFPLLTTKKLHLRSIIHELLWFLKGDTNISYLKDHNVRIWNEWADENGDLGPIYGRQWRSWEGPQGKIIDQITQVLKVIKEDPYSRRMIVNSWNVGEIENMALPPCHCLFQFFVHDNKLSCQLYQRSADIFLGVPFNIASYALLTIMIAQVSQLEVGEFIHSFGDVHLYSNHIDQAKEQLTRSPKTLPKMKLNPNINDLFAFSYSDFTLEEYDPYSSIKAKVAV